MRPPDRGRRLAAVVLLVALSACGQQLPTVTAPAALPDAMPARIRRALAALPGGWSDLPPPPAVGSGAVTV